MGCRAQGEGLEEGQNMGRDAVKMKEEVLEVGGQRKYRELSPR